MGTGLRVAAVARCVLGSVLVIASLLTSASAFQTGTASLPPPATGTFAYNSFVPSLLTGTTYVDPIFGETVRRLSTDHVHDDIYARNMWWNADETRYLHRTTNGTAFADYWEVIDVASGIVTHTGIPIGGSFAADGGFDPVDPNVLYYLGSDGLHQVTLNANGTWTNTVYFRPPGGAALDGLGGTLNWLDASGRYMLVRYGPEPSVYLYDRQNMAAGPYANPINATNYIEAGSYLGLSPDGQFIVGYDSSSGTGFGHMGEGVSWRIDHTHRSIPTAPNRFWSLCGDHGSFISPSDGRNYMIVNDCYGSAGLWRVDITNNAAGLNEAQQQALPNNRLLLAYPTWSDFGHATTVARGALRDWAMISTEDGSDTFNTGTADANGKITPWHPYRSEIVALNVITGEIRRMVHHRSRAADYYSTPRLSTSWGGKWIGFASNFNQSSGGNGVVDIYAVAFAAGDTTPPSVVLTAPAAGSSLSGVVSVAATASDNVGVAGVQFRLDGANLGAEVTVAPYAVAWNTAGALPGAHTLSAVARDTSGNTATATSISVTVLSGDTTPPTVAITAPAASTTVSGVATVTASASDNVGVAGVQFKLDGVNLGAEVTVAPYTLAWNTATATGGAHTLTAVARDTAGNSATSAGVVVTVDNADRTAPTVAVTAPATGATLSGVVSVTATASDNVGVVGVQFKLDGVNLGAEDTAGPYSVSWNTATSANGAHTLTAVARDAAGNMTTSAPVAITVANDVTPPTISALTASALSASGATITWTTSEAADSQVEYGLTTAYGSATPVDGNRVTSHGAALSGMAASTLYHYRVKSRDAAGNLAISGDATFTTLAVSDTNAGLVAYWPLDDGSGTTAADLSGNGHAGTLVNAPTWTAGRNGGALSFDGVSQSVAIPDSAALNAYPLSVVAWVKTTATSGPQGIVNKYVPASGNGYQVFLNAGSLCAWYFKDGANNVWDGTTCTLAAPGYADGVWHQVAFVVDAGGGQLFVDGVQKATRAWTGAPGATTTTQALSLGVYPGAAGAPYFAGQLDDVRVYNRALSAAEIIALAGPVSDTVPPAVAITAPADGATVSGTLTVAASAGDNIGVVGVQFQLDGANFGTEDTLAPWTVSWNTTLVTPGLHTLTAIARDAAGNVTTSAPVTVTTLGDITPPTVSVTAPASGATVSGTVTVSATAADDLGVVGVQLQLDGANLGAERTAAPYSLAWSTATTGNGPHTLTAVARDAAGNSTTSGPVTVTVANDVTAPTISGVTASSLSASGATITWTTSEASDSRVDYGPTTAYDSATPTDPTRVTAHSRVLSGLAAGTLYHYRVVSADAAGNPAVSGDFTLTTLAAPSPSAGLVGYWALDETAGTTAADSSGNGHPGTLINGPAWTTGRVGGALSFDGVSQSVSIPHSATLDPYPLTVVAWFQTSALTGPQGLVNKYVAASMNGYQIFMNAGSLCAWYFKDSTSYVRDDPTCSLATPGYADGLWHQVVFVVDAAAGWLYVDGVLKSSRVWTGTPGATITTQPLSLGVYPGAAGSPFFAGLLDDVRVYNRALGADEILALYDAGAGISSLETLTVTRAGTGKGSVTSDPAGIACPMNCQNNYPFDTVVALRAAALAGSAFTGWGGDAECTTGQVTMRSRKSCTATFTAMPDLTVTAVTAPASGLTSKTITVSNTVANTGGAAAGAFRVTLYMSPTDPTPGAGTPVGYRDVSSLAVGASSTASTVVTIPATAAAGAYYVSAVADSAGAVAELDETNNGRTAATTTAVALYRPDVTLTALTAPAGGSLGRTITVANTVRNQGTAPAGPFRITFYMSATDPTPGAGTAIGYRSLSGLAAGASSTANTALTIPSSLDPGPYYVSAVTDSTGALLELDATNDGMTAAAQMLVTFYRPDLVVSALSGPVSGAQGRSITIANTVRNQGTAPAGPFQVTFYLSPTDPMPGAGTAIGSRSLSSLAVGAASTAKTAVTIPATLDPGTYYLSAVADSAAALTELATTNNGRTAAGQLLVTYYRPDVMVTALTAPATGATGRTITVANTVSNQGTAPATAFRVTFYVSPTDPTPGAGTAIGFRDLTSLAAGAKSAAKTSVTIPATLDPGTYYLSAVADSGSALLELDATNDGLTATGQMVVTYYRPDLIVSALTAPATGATGQTITVPNTVRNQGPAPATAFRMTFYMSAADPTPGAGTAIGWRDISGLAAGASWVANTVLTIPAAFDPGTYYVSAIADSGRVLTELDATNNGRTAATTTTVSLYRPDVVMSALTAPAAGSTGRTITVANTVLNQGNAPAGPFQITFYMSATDATPGAGSAVGSRDVASLAAGASSAANTTVTIPAGFDLGTYYVSAIADSGGALVELDATNNGLTAPTMTQVALYRPDVIVSALTAPATAGIGRTLSVSNTVRNQGTAPAGKFRVTFYMWPADPGLGTSVAVGYRDIASLAVGAASTASTLVNVPVTFFPSTYYLSAVADGDHVLIELDASNNALVMTAPVEVVP